MREIWSSVLEELMDALAHTIAMLIGDELGTKGTYRRYRWRGKTYLIRKD